MYSSCSIALLTSFLDGSVAPTGKGRQQQVLVLGLVWYGLKPGRKTELPHTLCTAFLNHEVKHNVCPPLVFVPPWKYMPTLRLSSFLSSKALLTH